MSLGVMSGLAVLAVLAVADGDLPPMIDSSPSTVHARAGTATELVCAAQGHPPPTYR